LTFKLVLKSNKPTMLEPLSKWDLHSIPQNIPALQSHPTTALPLPNNLAKNPTV